MRRLHVSWLPDGKKLHLHNGAIDLIIQGFGRPAEVGRAYEAGIERTRALVLELADDLRPLQDGQAARTAVGQRAAAACAAVPGALPTVAALNGAVADEVIAAMVQGGQIDRGFVNNHGMVAFHVTEGHSLTLAAMDWPKYHRYEALIPVEVASRTRALAAAGWAFDGFALGWAGRIVSAAPSAAAAEAALGGIALCMRPDAGGEMVPANSLVPLSVLGGLKVCPALDAVPGDVAAALVAKGRAMAEALVANETITLAIIELGEERFLIPAALISDSWGFPELY